MNNLQNLLVDLEMVVSRAKDILWQGPLLILLLGVGLYLTIILRGVQFKYLGYAIRLILATRKANIKGTTGDINPFQSLMTALAGAIGTGNITGIATAVAIGGVGSLFWMWCMAFLGMATAYSETLLAVKYRTQNSAGGMSGGPMYTLTTGLGFKRIATLYALFGSVAAIGIGCLVQSNSIVDAITVSFPIDKLALGIILSILVWAVIISGVQTIGKVASFLVPFMALAYLCAGLIVLLVNVKQIIPGFQLIIASAFSGQAAIGGFVGSTLILAIQNGVQFGIFANEAGLGTLAMAGASAKTMEPAEQGMMSLCGVFISTMLICTITGLTLTVTNVLGMQAVNGKLLIGSPLVMEAFSSVHSSFSYIVLLSLILFAFTTILAWSYYGEKCIEFLFGLKVIVAYRWIFTLAVILGAVLELRLVWSMANLATALLALPNLIAIIALAKIVKSETSAYLAKITPKAPEGYPLHKEIKT